LQKQKGAIHAWGILKTPPHMHRPHAYAIIESLDPVMQTLDEPAREVGFADARVLHAPGPNAMYSVGHVRQRAPSAAAAALTVDGLLGAHLDFSELARLARLNRSCLAGYQTFWPELFRARALTLKRDGRSDAVRDFLEHAVANDAAEHVRVVMGASSAFRPCARCMLLDDGETLLHVAAQCNSAAAVDALLDAGRHAEMLLLSPDERGANCLSVAAAAGSEAAVRSLLRWCEHRPQLRKRLLLDTSATGASSAHAAASAGHLAVLEVLLAAAPELLRGVDDDGRSCLHAAAFAGHLAVLEVLLAAAPELLREVDNDGRSCLHVAVYAGRVQVVESLLGLGGARLLATRCRKGQTPLDMSVAMGADRITALLRAQSLL